MPKPTPFILAAALWAAGCASAQESAEPQAAATVRVYDATEISARNYTVVKRLWTGTWRASLWVPTYGSAEEARDALVEKAADLGADGVTNLSCLSDSAGYGGFFCYGLAIRMKEERPNWMF